MASILLLHILVVSLTVFFAQIGVWINEKRSIEYKLNYGYLISFIILLCFLGFRVSLGKDLGNYEKIYTSNLQQDYIFGESREIGFLLLIKILRFFDLEFQSFIFLTSLLILLLFYTSYRNFYYLLPFAIFVFFTDWGYIVTINTIRQGIALMAFLNASLYIDSNRKRAGLKFLFFIFIGFLFHYTILAFLPFYYIGRLKLKPIYFYCLCVTVFFLSVFIIMPAFEETLSLIEKYEKYLYDPNRMEEEHTFRLGATLLLLIRIAPLLLYNYVRREIPSFLKFYVLYFIGLSIYYGFFHLLLVTRFTFYLQFFELFVISYFLYFLLKKKKSIQLRFCAFIYTVLILFNFVYKFRDFLADQLVFSKFSLMFIDFHFRGV